MPKVKRWSSPGNGEAGYSFECPGCKRDHVIPTENSNHAWGFNGNPDAPTFTPSILARSGHYIPGQPPADNCANCRENALHPEEREGMECGICHSFVTDGRIEFLSDCTHPLAGKTVELTEITADD